MDAGRIPEAVSFDDWVVAILTEFGVNLNLAFDTGQLGERPTSEGKWPTPEVHDGAHQANLKGFLREGQGNE